MKESIISARHQIQWQMICDKWIKISPQAKKYKINGIYFHNDTDFIDKTI